MDGGPIFGTSVAFLYNAENRGGSAMTPTYHFMINTIIESMKKKNPPWHWPTINTKTTYDTGIPYHIHTIIEITTYDTGIPYHIHTIVEITTYNINIPYYIDSINTITTLTPM